MIADRTYHKLLHVSWLRADIDGDGIPEYIPASDQADRTPPDHVYLGGNIYYDWAVSDKYKVYKAEEPDPRSSTASLFSFTW